MKTNASIKSDFSISLQSLLNTTAALCAALSFFIGQELVSPLYTIGFLILMGWALLIEWRDLPHPPRLWVNLASIALLFAIAARVRRNYIVEAFIEALLVMIAVKMLERKKARDYLQIAGLCLAMIVCYAMLSVEKTFIVYCFGMGILITLMLILTTWFSSDPGAVLNGRETRQVVIRSLALFGMMLPLCLLLFFASPRSRTPLFGMRAQLAGATAVTGFSEQVRLGDVGDIQASNRLAFRVEMNSLSAQTPYWRGMILDIFDGGVWIASRRSANRGPFIPERDAPRIDQSIFLEPGNYRYLFALDQPLEITNIDTVPDGEGIFQYRNRSMGRRLQYNAVSVLSNRMKPINPVIDRRRYLALPADFLPRLRTVVDEITANRDDAEKIAAISDYLSPPDFVYSLENLPRDINALEQFLFSVRRGNCEYFASAMGVMLRMAGIPARLVAGYRGGAYNNAGGYYSVSEEKAHVWVEAWDDSEQVWVRYDPTPLGDAVSEEGESLFSMYLDLLDYQWSKMVVNYNWEVQGELVQNIREIIRNPRASLSPTKEGLQRFGGALALPAIIAGVVAFSGLAYQAFRAFRQRKPEQVLLQRFTRIMKKNAYIKHKNEGLEEFAARIDDPVLRDEAFSFIRNFEEFYYRDRPLSAEIQAVLHESLDRLAQRNKTKR